MDNNFSISGHIIDILGERIYKGEISVANGRIAGIRETAEVEDQYLLPGLIDSHVHIESSMLVPSEFARLSVVHGTVATVSDPHEIGNVLGVEGVKYMIENGKEVDFKFFFGAPSCVPATTFETAGKTITPNEIDQLLSMKEVKYLAEMMNWPGVLGQDPLVMEKLAVAKKHQKVIDGHAPGLRGEMALDYIKAGISTDHECFTKEEALDKLAHGMKIIIREGSAAKNFEALIPLLSDYENEIMFCSDDKHPDNLVEGHINQLVKRALAKGIGLFKVLKAACVNPVRHYGLEVGLLKAGDPADFIVIDHPETFKIIQTFINGKLVAENGETRIESVQNPIINNFSIQPLQPAALKLHAKGTKVNVIEALDGQLITNRLKVPCSVEDGFMVSNVEEDILKLVVINRYQAASPAIAFIKNFGLKSGAIASSVAHDSHNIIAVGVDDDSLCRAVNLIIEEKGGVSAVGQEEERVVPLPVAGLMSPLDGYEIARDYASIDNFSKKLGSSLNSPFMTLSFMALLVIPSCKLSDKGLFDGEKFEFIKLFEA
ncbi:adenine deaminase [Fulvivirgaceae bacterium BMA12]|uniref:Adenine deaminase n=1 Tax=Agaribacillus aureus TaxID=3051825 RepID=A0ABT8L0I8_9BACT|nr:adenine deaminase [Fulvivirgaceae bacterium BMA12]